MAVPRVADIAVMVLLAILLNLAVGPDQDRIEPADLVTDCIKERILAAQFLRQKQRVGIAFPDKKQLKKYLVLLEEAEKRDHRKIGQAMELFSIHEEAPGMPFFHDKGNFIWESLKDFMTQEMRALNYEINKTPIILNKQLYSLTW